MMPSPKRFQKQRFVDLVTACRYGIDVLAQAYRVDADAIDEMLWARGEHAYDNPKSIEHIVRLFLDAMDEKVEGVSIDMFRCSPDHEWDLQ